MRWITTGSRAPLAGTTTTSSKTIGPSQVNVAFAISTRPWRLGTFRDTHAVTREGSESHHGTTAPPRRITPRITSPAVASKPVQDPFAAAVGGAAGMSIGMAPAGKEGKGGPDGREGAASTGRRSVMVGEHLQASPGSDRQESIHPTEGESGKKEARSGRPKAGGNAPATVRCPAGKSWQNRHAPAPKKTGPPWREARSGLGRLLRTVVESRRRSTRAPGQAREERAPDDSGADGGRSSRGLGRNGRGSLGRHALGDHARTAAVAIRATAGDRATLDTILGRGATAARATARDGTALDHLTATTARATARSRGGIAAAAAAAVTGRSGRSSAVATTGSLLGVELGEKANTLLAMAAGGRSRSSLAARITSRGGFGNRSAVAALLGMELGEQTTMARLAAVTTVAGNRTRLTADEADGDERDDHRNRRTEETLHLESPGRKKSDATRSESAVTNRFRSGTATGPQQRRCQSGWHQPAGAESPLRNTPTTSGTAL